MHHALCNIIVPLFDRTFIYDSYANRLGKGNHRALRQFVKFSQTNPYVLQCDICKYFPSSDRQTLKTQLRRKIKCPSTLELIDRIIDSSPLLGKVGIAHPTQGIAHPTQGIAHPTQDRSRGLPIGNLTSQFFANVYLSGLDRFIKEQLNIKNYLRYVDDFALFHSDRHFLAEARIAIEAYLETGQTHTFLNKGGNYVVTMFKAVRTLLRYLSSHPALSRLFLTPTLVFLSLDSKLTPT